jgi:synaptosomal-associated protein 29
LAAIFRYSLVFFKKEMSKWQDAADNIESDFEAGKSWKNVDDEVEDLNNEHYIQRKTKKVQNDSLDTSSRILSKVENAQIMATHSLQKLSAQGEKLDHVEKRLHETEQHVKLSEVKTERLKSLNRFFMIPAFGNKAAMKKEEALAREMELEKELKMKEQLRQQEARERALNMHHQARASSMSGAGNHAAFYSTPEGLERDETEEKIDSNLSQIASGLGRLKLMGRSMNSELDEQRNQLNRIQDRTDINQERVHRLGSRMEQISRRK